MKKSNNQTENQERIELKAAFEKGYLLGREDFNEGIFIELGFVVEQFGNTLDSEVDVR